MAKLEEILKAKGLTDADIAAMGTLLSNQAYRTALEASYSELENERNAYRTRDEEWQQIVNEKYVPAVTTAEKAAIEARQEAAKYREMVKAAKDFGYLSDDDERKAAEKLEEERRAAAVGQPGKLNLNDPEFVQYTTNFAMREGDAMARYNYVSEEYRLLNGGSINDYVGKDGKRGMVALRAEALAAKKDIDVYASEKFNWDGKRAEQQAARQKQHDNEVARKAVEDYALKHGSNPMTAAPHASRMPLIPAKVDNGKLIQPWERPTAKSERLQRAYETETKARVN